MHPVSTFLPDDALPSSDGLSGQGAFILDQVDELIVVTDLANRVRYLNAAAARSFGVEEDVAQGRSLPELMDISHNGGSFEGIRAQLETSGTGQGALVLNDGAGTRLFTFSLRYLPGPAGPSGLLLMGRLSTRERSLPQDPRHKERFYHGLINDSLDGILVIDPTGLITFASPSIHRVLGHSAGEVLGRNAFEYVHPDDHAKTFDAFEKEVALAPEIKFVEVRVRNKNGNWTWCMVRGNNLMANPDVRGIVVYFQDDTLRLEASVALRESEARFRMLIANMHQGVLLHDATGRVLLGNEAVVELLGDVPDTAEAIVLGESGQDLINESGARFRLEDLPVPTVLRTGAPVRNVVIGYRYPGTGARRWLLANSAPVHNEEGAIAHVITSLTDISERKGLEAQLLAGQFAHQRQLTQATIDSSERERAAIGKELHDNIGQQLTTIKLYLDLARATADEETAEMVALATRNVSDVINEIRGLCRALIPSTLGDIGLVESVNDLIYAFTRTRHIAIRFRVDAFDEELVPESQKLMLFRILQEQLNNIVK
ncbi:MAG: PAS domain S-box protein, partial [Chitinophagaceae bacterium]